MSGPEFLLWYMDYTSRPWGELRDDFRAGQMINHNYAANNVDPKKLPPLRDYVLFQGETKAASESHDGFSMDSMKARNDEIRNRANKK